MAIEGGFKAAIQERFEGWSLFGSRLLLQQTAGMTSRVVQLTIDNPFLLSF